MNNLKYDTPVILNNIIQCIGKLARIKISDELKEAKCLSLLCDESKNISNSNNSALTLAMFHHLNKLK